MTCRHQYKVNTAKYKGQTIYNISCPKCGRRTVWGENLELAKEFMRSCDELLLVKRGDYK
nr:MAG TPA: cysteine-rich protein [Caudoviricetes sp.]